MRGKGALFHQTSKDEQTLKGKFFVFYILFSDLIVDENRRNWKTGVDLVPIKQKNERSNERTWSLMWGVQFSYTLLSQIPAKQRQISSKGYSMYMKYSQLGTSRFFFSSYSVHSNCRVGTRASGVFWHVTDKCSVSRTRYSRECSLSES